MDIARFSPALWQRKLDNDWGFSDAGKSIYCLNIETGQAELIHDREADLLNVASRRCRIRRVTPKTHIDR